MIQAKRDIAQFNNSVNCVCSYLARRDLNELSAGEIKRLTGAPHVDALLSYGCDLTEVPEMAARTFHDGLCSVLLFSGGVGHGTQGLRKNARMKYGIDCANMAEAEIMAEIAVRHLHVPKEKVYIEGSSTNSGENARFSLELLRKNNVPAKSILLLQDPLMQQRSHLATLMTLDPGFILLSYAPFIPHTDGCRPWPDERFYDLILREIPRIYDDEHGYGPNGKNFIVHADVPAEVMQSYLTIKRAFNQYFFTER